LLRGFYKDIEMKKAISMVVVLTFAAACTAPSNMVLIHGGTFIMGSPENEIDRDDDEPQHKVTVSSFYMGRTEVNQKDYKEVMGINPSSFKGDNLPVEGVTWFNAIEFCNRLSDLEGLTPAYTVKGTNVTWDRSADGYRLPTGAEWEYACRAGTQTPFSTGNNITTKQANYDGFPYNNNPKGTIRDRTVEVKSFAPNAWGLYNMHGNVWEWCWDLYGEYASGDQIDPVGASSGSERIVRGGGWRVHAQYLRSANRYKVSPSHASNGLGFRLVLPHG
jgi:formylglycine-generating enzyme required for sulfatase activity